MTTLWSLILFASVAVGAFMLILILTGQKSNHRATYLLAALLTVLMATNIDNWLYASGNWLQALRVVGFSRASILLVGPLLFLYAQSVTDNAFRFRPAHVLHLLPYVVAFIYLFPLIFLSDLQQKKFFIQAPLESAAEMPVYFRLILALYILGLAIYMILTLRLIKSRSEQQTTVNLSVPLSYRLKWLRKLAISMVATYTIIALPLLSSVITGQYLIQVNYAMTCLYSILIYYAGIAYINNREVVIPGFTLKYETVPENQSLSDECAKKLMGLFEVQKIYLDPELTLGKVAALMEMPSGYVSRHINQRHGKSFPDFVNSYRVEEFKKRLPDPNNQHFTMFGLAMEVGFSSKSTFNAAFKKITGYSPTDFKNSKN